jgi:hypothetical protein
MVRPKPVTVIVDSNDRPYGLEHDGVMVCVGKLPGRKRAMLYAGQHHASSHAYCITPLASFSSATTAEQFRRWLAAIVDMETA